MSVQYTQLIISQSVSNCHYQMPVDEIESARMLREPLYQYSSVSYKDITAPGKYKPAGC